MQTVATQEEKAACAPSAQEGAFSYHRVPPPWPTAFQPRPSGRGNALATSPTGGSPVPLSKMQTQARKAP